MQVRTDDKLEGDEQSEARARAELGLSPDPCLLSDSPAADSPAADGAVAKAEKAAQAKAQDAADAAKDSLRTRSRTPPPPPPSPPRTRARRSPPTAAPSA